MARNKQDRKTVEIARKKIPLRTMLHKKEIREAAKALENFRLKFKEEEFLYGGRITVEWNDYSNSVEAVVRRPETDKEYEDRLEKLRIAEEQKQQREIKKQQQEQQRRAEMERRKKEMAVEIIKSKARELGLDDKDLVDILNKVA